MTSRYRISSHSLRAGGDTIEYEVRRSARRKKTVQLSVRDGGAVIVNAPARMKDVDIREFVRSRADWIAATIAEQEARAPGPLKFVSGETLPYLGDPVELVVRSVPTKGSEEPSVRLARRRLHVTAPRDLPEPMRPSLMSGAIANWFADRARERLTRDVDRWWTKLGRGDRSRIKILIGNQRSRWGSCSSDGKIRFSWRVMMLEPALIDYIVAHELAHLSVMNHSRDFWAVVETAMPDWKKRRATLREMGQSLPL